MEPSLGRSFSQRHSKTARVIWLQVFLQLPALSFQVAPVWMGAVITRRQKGESESNLRPKMNLKGKNSKKSRVGASWL